MPIYEYQCGQCQHKLERIQKFSDEPLKECPECGKESLERLISVPNFQLKGTGWYVTDFKDKDKKTESKDTKPQDKKADNTEKARTNADTKSDSKSESKVESTQKSDLKKETKKKSSKEEK